MHFRRQALDGGRRAIPNSFGVQGDKLAVFTVRHRLRFAPLADICKAFDMKDMNDGVDAFKRAAEGICTVSEGFGCKDGRAQRAD